MFLEARIVLRGMAARFYAIYLIAAPVGSGNIRLVRQAAV
jgi:hypothetical protein